MAKAQIGLALALLVFSGCGGQSESTGKVNHAVGTPCIGADETRPDVSSHAVSTVVIEDTAEANLFCLYNHFQGRVSCPFGQTEADLSLPETDPGRCLTPEGTAVTVEVDPQLSARRPPDAVYQSCRCAGPEPDATYCACPNGFQCSFLIDDLGGPGTNYAGSYCLRAGTAWNPDADYGPACDRSVAPGSPGHCE